MAGTGPADHFAVLGVKFQPPLQQGTLIRRYKRFLADVLTADGVPITIHCPNTGSMKYCGEPGDVVWFSTSANARRKYAHTWELCRSAQGDLIGINAGRANSLVRAAVVAGVIAELGGYGAISSEVKYGSEGSRIDLLLADHGTRPDCFVEVKSVTLLEAPASAGIGYFPDAVSVRATKHLRELGRVVAEGRRGVICFCVQHTGIREVRPATHIDPVYGASLTEAMAMGVEVIAYRAQLSTTGILLDAPVPVVIAS
jgi:sugar fermentation stimulation protein A